MTILTTWTCACRTRRSTETLFVQARGALRKELTACLRTGRAQRRPHMRTEHSGAGRLRNMVLISDRPPEVEDRAVPGHWEGDLIIGKGGRSAIGTLVERSSRYVMLLHLPHGRTAEDVRAALTRQVSKLPAELRRTLTWDQGKEMAEHVRFSTDTNMEVYFCDPHSPWQRGSNENTNGLLRQYFPSKADLSLHSAAHLNAVARELNNRPRQTLELDETIRSVLAGLLRRSVEDKQCWADCRQLRGAENVRDRFKFLWFAFRSKEGGGIRRPPLERAQRRRVLPDGLHRPPHRPLRRDARSGAADVAGDRLAGRAQRALCARMARGDGHLGRRQRRSAERPLPVAAGARGLPDAGGRRRTTWPCSLSMSRCSATSRTTLSSASRTAAASPMSDSLGSTR